MGSGRRSTTWWLAPDTIGPQAGNIGRLSWLAAGFDEAVPGVTVDRQCGSSQQAISLWRPGDHRTGNRRPDPAGGMQNMSAILISSAMTVAEQFGFTSPTNETKEWLERYGIKRSAVPRIRN